MLKLIIIDKKYNMVYEDSYHSNYCTLQCNDMEENFYYFEIHLWTQWIFARCVIILGNCAMCALNWKVWCEFSSGLLSIEFTLIPSSELNLKSYWHSMWLYREILGSAIICILLKICFTLAWYCLPHLTGCILLCFLGVGSWS